MLWRIENDVLATLRILRTRITRTLRSTIFAVSALALLIMVPFLLWKLSGLIVGFGPNLKPEAIAMAPAIELEASTRQAADLASKQIVRAFCPPVAAIRLRPETTQTDDPPRTIRCSDGTWSSATRRSGACSSHGGIALDPYPYAQTSKPSVSRSVDGSASKSEASRASRSCSDGSASSAGRGACSHHGGLVSASRARRPRSIRSRDRR